MKVDRCVLPLVLCVFIFGVRAEAQIQGEITYRPPVIPIQISLNASGQISVSASHTILTPWGSFGFWSKL